MYGRVVGEVNVYGGNRSGAGDDGHPTGTLLAEDEVHVPAVSGEGVGLAVPRFLYESDVGVDSGEPVGNADVLVRHGVGDVRGVEVRAQCLGVGRAGRVVSWHGAALFMGLGRRLLIEAVNHLGFVGVPRVETRRIGDKAKGS